MRRITVAFVALAAGLGGCVAADAEFQDGVEQFGKADYAAAERHAATAVSISPGTKKYVALLGWSKLKQGDLEGAEHRLAQLRDIDPGYIETTQLSAWEAFARAAPAEARKGFKDELAWAEMHRHKSLFPIKYHPKDVRFINAIFADGHYGLGLLALNAADAADAQDHLTRAASVPTYLGRQGVLEALADSQTRQGDHASALATLAEAHDGQPTASESPLALEPLVLTGQIDAAVAAVAPVAGPAASPALRPFLHALYEASQGHGPQADKAMDDAVYLAPAPLLPDLLARLAASNTKVRAWADSYGRKLYKNLWYWPARGFLAVSLSPKDCAGRGMLAWADYYATNTQVALGEFQALVADKCPVREDVLTGQAATQLALGLLDGADESFALALEANPRYARARLGRGAVAYLRGDYKGAIQSYVANIGVLPRSEAVWSWGSHALNNLGWSYYLSGDYVMAKSIFTTLATYHQGVEYAAPQAALGWVALKQGHKGEAKKRFLRALEIVPGAVLAQSGLDALAAAP